jgi:hypothetical protein
VYLSRTTEKEKKELLPRVVSRFNLCFQSSKQHKKNIKKNLQLSQQIAVYMDYYDDVGAQPRSVPYVSRSANPFSPQPIDPMAVAYQAGRVDADTERIGFENATRRNGYVQPDYGSVTHGLPIYPARGIRRSTTLPVRFEDERYEPVARYVVQPRPVLREEEQTPTTGRLGSLDSWTSSDSEAEQKKRPKDDLIIVNGEREPLVAKEKETVAQQPSSRVDEPRSRYRSPVRPREKDVVETSHTEDGKSDGQLSKRGTTKIPTRL